MTAAKEVGASIEISGKTVALGIPGAKPPTVTGGADPKTYSSIPLARPGTADEAASAMLLCVLFHLDQVIGSCNSFVDFGWGQFGVSTRFIRDWSYARGDGRTMSGNCDFYRSCHQRELMCIHCMQCNVNIPSIRITGSVSDPRIMCSDRRLR